MTLSAHARAEVDRLLAEYPDKRSVLLPAMKLAQHEVGYLRREEIDELGDIFDISPNVLFQLASFYSMLHLKPRGQHHVELCDGLPCVLRGTDGMAARMAERLGSPVGATTPDGKITFTRIECIGSCDRAPALLVDEHYVENVTDEMFDRLMDELKAGRGVPVDMIRDPDLLESLGTAGLGRSAH